MRLLWVLVGLLFLNSCSPKLKGSFSTLSRPEKTWVAFHPFKAKRAYRISVEAIRVTDSIKQTNIVGTDISGGKLDALKHSYWMARLTQRIGKRAAYSLGKAHEKGNYLTFKKRQLEDGAVPDKPATEMDLFNNQIGIGTGITLENASKNRILTALINSINEGELRILLKNNQGQYLDCQKKIIPLDSLKNKWDTKKCLVPSNQ